LQWVEAHLGSHTHGGTYNLNVAVIP
jgi:hypothetical protein